MIYTGPRALSIVRRANRRRPFDGMGRFLAQVIPRPTLSYGPVSRTPAPFDIKIPGAGMRVAVAFPAMANLGIPVGAGDLGVIAGIRVH